MECMGYWNIFQYACSTPCRHLMQCFVKWGLSWPSGVCFGGDGWWQSLKASERLIRLQGMEIQVQKGVLCRCSGCCCAFTRKAPLLGFLVVYVTARNQWTHRCAGAKCMPVTKTNVAKYFPLCASCSPFLQCFVAYFTESGSVEQGIAFGFVQNNNWKGARRMCFVDYMGR